MRTEVHTGFQMEKFEVDYSEDPGIERRIILKWILRILDGKS
jgi:hypothetical protein